MEADRFDDLLRSLPQTPSRRGITRAVLGFALVGPLGALLGPADSEARKKKRKKKKKCKGGTKKCGKTCIPTAACCIDCGDLGVCEDGVCACLSEGKPCQGTCIPIAGCCSGADCGQNAVCAGGECACRSGFKDCQGECIALGVCCGDAFDCGLDAHGSCSCETEVGGGKICHKDDPEALLETCGQCPSGTHCVNVGGGGGVRCYKLCGAS